MAEHHVREEDRGTRIGDYWPLASLIITAALAGAAIAAQAGETFTAFMHGFMGVFLVVFALLKIFDLEGFKDGFAMYDLLASRFSAWGYVYPFVELALGLAYLGHFSPTLTYIVTIIVFGFGTIGVVSALRRGLDINCPCMGSVLAVPLSTVTLTEDLGMIAMAALMLVI